MATIRAEIAPPGATGAWEHPATARHLRQLADDVGPAVHVVPPVSKVLACDDEGIGAMAPRDTIVTACGLR